MPWYASLLLTVLLIVASAFFVVIEFSLLAARRNRLEATAGSSRASRAALRGMNELTMMLAGAQLGITAATFALGAVTKPAVHHGLMPLLELLALPAIVADGAAFALSLFIVTFLHLVIGEMAPKSWAIAHPETAARLIGVPANAMVTVLRPLLGWINTRTNHLVKRAGVEPVDRAAAGGYDAATLRSLVEHSTEAGALDEESGTQISRIIRFEYATVGDLVASRSTPPTSVSHDATVADVQRAARESGHFRVLVRPHRGVGAPGSVGLVHVRDTLLADGAAAASGFTRDVLHLGESTTLQGALEAMRDARHQLAVVVPDEGPPKLLGVITSGDLLDQIWPSIEEGLGRPE
jgi:CBS domain containing-hemolysin-like protein